MPKYNIFAKNSKIQYQKDEDRLIVNKHNCIIFDDLVIYNISYSALCKM
jgi:hypothetical protein